MCCVIFLVKSGCTRVNTAEAVVSRTLQFQRRPIPERSCRTSRYRRIYTRETRYRILVLEPSYYTCHRCSFGRYGWLAV